MDVDQNPELRVPFAMTPHDVEAWLRAERPGPKRLATMVDAQPVNYRPQLRRLLREAAEAIADSDVASSDELEARNHAKHLLLGEQSDVLTRSDVVPVDPKAEQRAHMEAVAAENEALRLRIAALEDQIAELPTGDPADGDDGVAEAAEVVDRPAPSAEEVARSAAILDDVLEDIDADEVAPYSGPIPPAFGEDEA